jgi:hypothetical protein
MSFHVASMRRTCLVAVGVLISTPALAQRGGRQEAPPPPASPPSSPRRRCRTQIELVGRLNGPKACGYDEACWSAARASSKLTVR